MKDLKELYRQYLADALNSKRLGDNKVSILFLNQPGSAEPSLPIQAPETLRVETATRKLSVNPS
jgi:hypothetical protein